MRFLRLSLLLASVLCVAGCVGYWSSGRPNSGSYAGSKTFGESSRPVAMDVVMLGRGAAQSDVSAAVRDSLAKMGQMTPQNKVLMYSDLGIVALQANDLDQAKRLLEDARLIIGDLTSTARQTANATSAGSSESDKVFKGEAHERALLYLNNGLIFLAEGDLDNAQACFKSGALEDAVARDDTHRGDWLSLDLLLLECARRQGRTTDCKELVSYIRSKYQAEELPAGWDDVMDPRMLCIVMVGPSPEKIAGKSKGDELQYRKVDSRVAVVRATIGQATTCEVRQPVDDCYVQATTRGRRKMDDVLAGKAGARTGVEAVGSGLAFAAPLVPVVGPLLSLTKEVSWSISDRIDSSADRRQMRMVPGRIFMIFGRPATPGQSVLVQALDASNRVIGEGEVQVQEPVGDGALLLARFPY